MKNEDKKVNDKENSLLHLLRKLYDRQFPQMRSCFELLAIKDKIEDLQKANHTYNGWLIRIGYLLVAIWTFNFQFVNYFKEWKDSPYHSVVTWLVIGCSLWALISAFTKLAMHYSPVVTRYEIELCNGGFDYYEDVEKVFTTLIQKFSWCDIKTTDELVKQIENDTRFIVYLIKKGEAYPDNNKRNPFLKKFEDDLLDNLIVLICLLGLMKVNDAGNITTTDSNSNIFKKRNEWLRKKLFEEVAV